MKPTRLDPSRVSASRQAGVWRNRLLDADLREGAARWPERLAIVAGERRLTYAELERLTTRAAAALTALGVGAGEVVSWQLPNWIETVVLHHAVIRIGAVSNPIVPIYREREVGFILRQSQARVLFTPALFRGFDHGAMAEALAADLPTLKHVFTVDPLAGGPELGLAPLIAAARPHASNATAPARRPEDVVLLLYTSGTTADPKGALHTHETLDYENRSIIDLYGLTEDDTVFMPSPLAHITGVLYGLHLPFMLGAKLVLQDVWKADEALRLVREHHCRLMIAATPFLHGLVDRVAAEGSGPTPLRTFGCGGADVPPELVRRGETVLGCLTTRVYGSTEFPTLSACNAGHSLEDRATTDGAIIGAARCRVVDEAGEPLPLGVPGDLEVLGPEMFVGYLDAALNEDAFTADGWFRTGDIAALDAHGCVTITARRKDIIIRGGENISAREVEDLVFEHPAVADVAVVGAPDPILVERVCACIVLRDGGSLDKAELSSFLRARGVAIQKTPEQIMLFEHLPRTASGKIQKFRLREMLRQI